VVSLSSCLARWKAARYVGCCPSLIPQKDRDWKHQLQVIKLLTLLMWRLQKRQFLSALVIFAAGHFRLIGLPGEQRT
jgi:hypothetical protein